MYERSKIVWTHTSMHSFIHSFVSTFIIYNSILMSIEVMRSFTRNWTIANFLCFFAARVFCFESLSIVVLLCECETMILTFLLSPSCRCGFLPVCPSVCLSGNINDYPWLCYKRERKDIANVSTIWKNNGWLVQ